MQELMIFIVDHGVKLGLAVLLGGIIGLEREASDKPAGLRTNILICLGSTLMMILSIEVARRYAVTVADPGRIAQGVITGVGFLGAGTILHSRGGVTGLTTAATTWAVAGIGLALGAGFFMLAATTGLLILIVLWVLGWVAKVMPAAKAPICRLSVVADDPVSNLEKVRSMLEQEGVALTGWNYQRTTHGHSVVVECAAARDQVPRLLSLIALSPGVRAARKL